MNQEDFVDKLLADIVFADADDFNSRITGLSPYEFIDEDSDGLSSMTVPKSMYIQNQDLFIPANVKFRFTLWTGERHMKCHVHPLTICIVQP